MSFKGGTARLMRAQLFKKGLFLMDGTPQRFLLTEMGSVNESNQNKILIQFKSVAQRLILWFYFKQLF